MWKGRSISTCSLRIRKLLVPLFLIDTAALICGRVQGGEPGML